jgi:predicted lipid-binding transport protein (Tim44 family)
MRNLKGLAMAAAVLSILTAVTAMAQQPSHQHDPAQKPPASSATPSMPAQSEHAHMAQHMEMCRQMMGQGGMMGGGMMGGGMMGMPMMMGGDPKQQAEMLAMRGEMMKAMGDIMMKYAQRAQSVK